MLEIADKHCRRTPGFGARRRVRSARAGIGGDGACAGSRDSRCRWLKSTIWLAAANRSAKSSLIFSDIYNWSRTCVRIFMFYRNAILACAITAAVACMARSSKFRGTIVSGFAANAAGRRVDQRCAWIRFFRAIATCRAMHSR